jgi:hypothetical protein
VSATAPAAEAPAAGPFTRRAVLMMVLVGVFAFSAMAVLSAYAPDFRGDDQGAPHVLSRSAVGFAGVARLLRDTGTSVEVSRRRADRRDPHWSLLVLTPDKESDPGALRDLTASGPTLIVLPKWVVTPDLMRPGWVLKAGPIGGNCNGCKDGNALAARPAIKRFADLQVSQRNGVQAIGVTGLGRRYNLAPIDSLQTLTAAGLEPVLTDGYGGVIAVATPDRKTVLLADPDLLNTQGIKDLATARLALDLLQSLRQGDGPIAFDVTLNGLGAPPSLLKLALQPPFLGATLCLAGAALLMGLHAINAFGAPRRRGRAVAFGKRALADNAAALIRQARREPRMIGRYLALVRADVGRALGAPRLEPEALDAFLERLGERRGVSPSLAALAAEAGTVRTPAELIRTARNIHRWRGEMTGERR